MKMEQVAGIGPATYPWEGHVLPLNYTCEKILTNSFCSQIYQICYN